MLAALCWALAKCKALSCGEACCELVREVVGCFLVGCCEFSNVTMTSFFPKPPHLLCPVIVLVSWEFGVLLTWEEFFLAWFSMVSVTTLYSSLSRAESRMWIGSGSFCLDGCGFLSFWLFAVRRVALRPLVFFVSATAGAMGVTLPERGRADGPREPSGAGST